MYYTHGKEKATNFMFCSLIFFQFGALALFVE